MKHKTKLPESTSPRIDIMCGDDDDSIENLRFRRDIALRDGDAELALQCSIAIDRLRGLYQPRKD